MRTLQILMPLAGLGQRFQDAGYATPKPLIPVDRLPMFQKALKSFVNDKTGRECEIADIFSVIRQEHQDHFGLADLLRSADKRMSVIIIPDKTRGAAETCMFARDQVDSEGGLVILDCDLWFQSNDYVDFIAANLIQENPEYSGALAYFTANTPRYSFIKTVGDRVDEIAEKKMISDKAVIGAYFFSKAREFFDEAGLSLQGGLVDTNEYYISLVIARLLRKGRLFKCFKATGYHSFGTPEELNTYLGRKS